VGKEITQCISHQDYFQSDSSALSLSSVAALSVREVADCVFRVRTLNDVFPTSLNSLYSFSSDFTLMIIHCL